MSATMKSKKTTKIAPCASMGPNLIKEWNKLLCKMRYGTTSERERQDCRRREKEEEEEEMRKKDFSGFIMNREVRISLPKSIGK